MDFFIGYNWPVQPDLWRAVRRAALGIGLGVVGLSGVLAVGHLPLEGGVFDFGHVTEHTGTVVEHPYPMLRHADSKAPWALLVARGKHGASQYVRGLDGKTVALKATRVARGAYEMLELAEAPGITDAGTSRTDALQYHGRLTLVGEVVDSKCFLGVMVPGQGTTHRGCAALCLRGGIPAALHVRQADGSSALYLIAGPAVTGEVLAPLAGQIVEMTGSLTRLGGWQVLTTEPGGWRRHER
jgi:hypothetical protein